MQLAKSLITVANVNMQLGRKLILQDINLSIGKNQIITVVGPNGAGKSTLVHILLGLLKPTQGTVTPDPSLRLGYMPQKFRMNYLLPLTVRDFLNMAQGFEKKHLEDLSQQLGITKIMQTQLMAISGGELQRVLLARALLNRPNLLVLDEPTQGIDLSGQLEFYNLVQEIKNIYQCSIFMVSHDLHFVMAGTDEVVCLNQHICCQGHPEEIRDKPEFLNLFGQKESAYLAFYMHEHHHTHNLDGSIKND